MYDYKPVSVPDDVLMAARSGQETVARLAAQSNAPPTAHRPLLLLRGLPLLPRLALQPGVAV